MTLPGQCATPMARECLRLLLRGKQPVVVCPARGIDIVLEGFRREVTVNDLCRREGIKPHFYYAWIKEFMEAGKERLARDTLRDATKQEAKPSGERTGSSSRWWVSCPWRRIG